MDNTPILNGAPAFIILGFTVALAAYLRQVSLSAQDAIDKIKSNTVRIFPYDEGSIIEEHTKEKLKLLKNTRESLGKITRPLFVLMLFIAIRIILYALSRLGFSDSGKFISFLCWFDLGISLSIFSMISGLWFMHERARKKDRHVLELTTAWEQARKL